MMRLPHHRAPRNGLTAIGIKQNSNVGVRYEKLYFSDEEAEHELLAVVLHVEQLVQMWNDVASPCLPGFVQFSVFIR